MESLRDYERYMDVFGFPEILPAEGPEAPLSPPNLLGIGKRAQSGMFRYHGAAAGPERVCGLGDR